MLPLDEKEQILIIRLLIIRDRQIANETCWWRRWLRILLRRVVI